MTDSPTLKATLLAVAALALLLGCSDGVQSPMSSDQPPAALAKPGGQKHRTVDASTTGVSSTTDQLYTQSDHGLFSDHQGGTLKVTMPVYGDETTVRVKHVLFEVEPGSLTRKVKIRMTCYSGYTLEDVWVAFDPAGVTFAPPARLTLHLWGPVTAEDVQEVRHIYGSGSNVESITTEVSTNGEAFLKIVFDVPGFSEYSLGGDDDDLYADEADAGDCP